LNNSNVYLYSGNDTKEESFLEINWNKAFMIKPKMKRLLKANKAIYSCMSLI